MRVLFDQSFDRRLVPYFKAAGHDVTVIAVDYPPSLTDREVLSVGEREARLILTNDRDFGELAIREHLPHAGILYLRMRQVTADAKWQRLATALQEHAHQLDRFLVVTENSVRVR